MFKTTKSTYLESTLNTCCLANGLSVVKNNVNVVLCRYNPIKQLSLPPSSYAIN